MELIMVRETILSPSHYRVTTFLFSYYSPVTMKTRSEEPHAALFYWKTFISYNSCATLVSLKTPID